MILLTGGSGFLGSVILQNTQERIVTLGRQDSNDIIADLRQLISVNLPDFDLVIHAAGKAHSVPHTDEEKEEFFSVNVIGTKNLLAALKRSIKLPRAFVFISSVAVYGVESGDLINEQQPLNAIDPYGKSKIICEQLVREWCNVNDVKCAILRLPLIAGPNAPGNLRAMINGIKKGYYFNIDGGKARKSMVLAADVAKLVPTVATKGGTYNLTDRHAPSFTELSGVIAQQLNVGKVRNMPMWIAKGFAAVGNIIGDKFPINSKKLAKITNNLTFDDSKAVQNLNWNPAPVLSGFKIS